MLFNVDLKVRPISEDGSRAPETKVLRFRVDCGYNKYVREEVKEHSKRKGLVLLQEEKPIFDILEVMDLDADWERSTNARTSELRLDQMDVYADFIIKATNMENVVARIWRAEGYDLYEQTDRHNPVFIDHGKTPKELKIIAIKMMIDRMNKKLQAALEK